MPVLSLITDDGPLTLEFQGDIGVAGAPVDVDFDITALSERIRRTKEFRDYFELTVKALTSGVTEGPTPDLTFLDNADGVPITARVSLSSTGNAEQILAKARLLHSIIR